MKKPLHYIALSVLVFTVVSCQKNLESSRDIEEDVTISPISFAVEPEVKSLNQVTIANLRSSGFKVLATNITNTQTYFMSNVQYNSSGNYFVPTPTTYNWDQQHNELNFFAVYPKAKSINLNAQRQPYIDVTASDNDVVIAANSGQVHTLGSVHMNFKHIMAAVRILYTTSTNCTVTEATLQYNSSGRYFFPSTTSLGGGQSSEGTWQNLSTSSMNLTTGSYLPGLSYMITSKEVAVPGTATIRIKYKLGSSSYIYDLTRTVELPAGVMTDVVCNFNPN